VKGSRANFAFSTSITRVTEPSGLRHGNAFPVYDNATGMTTCSATTPVKFVD
jgi:hypothetical protein